MQPLAERLRQGATLVGAAVGSGMAAAAAESGGADLLMVLNAGHFRTQGVSSAAALMPFAPANAICWQLLLDHVQPRVHHTPLFIGLCAQDPGLDIGATLAQARASGLAGVTNFPSVGFIDGLYREALEEAGMGFEREVALLKAARDAGLLTIGFCFTPAEAMALSQAGIDLLCLNLGFADARPREQAVHQAALDEAVLRILQVSKALAHERRRPPMVIFGGPVLLPQDTAQVYQRTDVIGYIGGSTVERYPAAPLISQTVRDFKQLAVQAGESGKRLDRLGSLVGSGEAMRQVFETIRRAAPTDVPVLIVGESGTGKELAAREIHRLSRRAHKSLITWNCGATPESLAMSELFGHEKGAFTGAASRRLGRFEIATAATLFMDEVTELPAAVQASLLRVIQEREIVRVGSERTIPVDVRLIAATNQDLTALVRGGRFRLDLYYRLSTIVLRIPPLRERREDIPLLIWELAREFSQHYGMPVPSIPQRMMQTLLDHPWPGNIRELKNVMERLFILGQGERLREEWLADCFAMARALEGPPAADGAGAPRAWGMQPGGSPDALFGRGSAEAVKPLRSRAPEQAADPAARRIQLSAALAACGGNKAAAARRLGVTRKTIYEWLKDQG